MTGRKRPGAGHAFNGYSGGSTAPGPRNSACVGRIRATLERRREWRESLRDRVDDAAAACVRLTDAVLIAKAFPTAPRLAAIMPARAACRAALAAVDMLRPDDRVDDIAAALVRIDP